MLLRRSSIPWHGLPLDAGSRMLHAGTAVTWLLCLLHWRPQAIRAAALCCMPCSAAWSLACQLQATHSGGTITSQSSSTPVCRIRRGMAKLSCHVVSQAQVWLQAWDATLNGP